MRGPVPHLPGAPWPLRVCARPLASFVGQSETEVREALGEPDECAAGSSWGGVAEGLATVLGAGGAVMDGVAVFGPVPRAIPRLVPYETWTYHNVGGVKWLLFLGRPGARAGTPHDAPAPSVGDRLRNFLRRSPPREWKPSLRVVLEVAQAPELASGMP